MDLTFGEWFDVAFVLVAVVSVPLWAWLGGRIGSRLSRGSDGGAETGASTASSDTSERVPGDEH